MTYDEAYAGLMKTVRNWEIGRDNIDVLEAGGGSLAHVPIEVSHKITLLDISPEQLENNEYADVKILCDLHQIELEKDAYDIVIAWDVLEHLEDPKLVLNNLLPSLKSDGILILSFPNIRSLQGMIVGHTPHFFHVFVYKYILGREFAGQPGHAPFPTVHHKDVAPDRLLEWGKNRDLSALYFAPYESRHRDLLRERLPKLDYAFGCVLRLMNFVTRRRLDDADVILVFAKRPLD